MTIRRVSHTVTTLAVAAAACIGVRAGEVPASPARSGGTVFVLPIKGPIDKGLLYVFRRAFGEVARLKPAAVVIELDTPGGRLRETEEIISWMRSADTRIYAFVRPRALSAGAIISLGTDGIFMAPGSRIGSAMPIMMNPLGGGIQEMPDGLNEKILSDTRSLVRGLAQENEYDEEVAMAMVDRSREFVIGDRVVCSEDELLNLTAKEAIEIVPPRKEPLLATAIVDDVERLLEHVGLGGAEIVRFEEEASERLARWITLIGPVLLALGAMGVYMEIRTPGFGVPGVLGLSLLIIYFFGHYVAGLAGLEDIVLVLIGFVLLVLEIFVIPGFGVAGVLGILCVTAGLLMGLIPHIPRAPVSLPEMETLRPAKILAAYVRVALRDLAVSGAVGALGLYLLGKILPKTPLYRSLVLEAALTRDEGYVSGGGVGYESYIGHSGVAMTPLRPAGTGVFGDDRLDVMSSGDLIAKGAAIVVTEVRGTSIVVEEQRPEEGAGVGA